MTSIWVHSGEHVPLDDAEDEVDDDEDELDDAGGNISVGWWCQTVVLVSGTIHMSKNWNVLF